MADDEQKITTLAMRPDETSSGKKRPRKADPASKRNVNTVNQRGYVEARILWPALGFPAVVSPTSAGGGLPTRDPTRCIYVLLLTNKRKLHKGDVARHLRYVPWEKRHTRWLPPARDGGTNAFAETDMEVFDKLRLLSNRGDLSQVYYFAADREGENGIMVTLSKYVRRFYWRRGLRYLREIHILEHAAARLQPGLHHLFWVNENKQDTSKNRSAEFQHLVGRGFAKQSRFGHDGVKTWKELKKTPSGRVSAKKAMSEYVWDFRKPRTLDNRTEVLHPLFIQNAHESLKIGHLTDLHVSIRADAYEKNLKAASVGSKFNNWNKTCAELYKTAKQKSNVLLMTGDLIDYGRGYNEQDGLGDDTAYWRDRNWFLFYEMLASGDKYDKPVYTILGNHDWRLNPYPPFAKGAPRPGAMNLTEDELKKAHGPGHEPRLSYAPIAPVIPSGLWQKFGKREGTLDVKTTPAETSVHSVAWYLLLINPFLDYLTALPGGYSLLMLDWGKGEKLDMDVIKGGINYGRHPFVSDHGGPAAKDSLSSHQTELVEQFVGASQSAKILGIHAPVLGPWPHWTDDHLQLGRVKWDPGDRGHADRGEVDHVALAYRSKDDPEGREADYGTILDKRDWLIKALRKAQVSLVCSGHIHRKNLLVVDKSLVTIKGVPAPLVRTIWQSLVWQASDGLAPLYVNTTSAGPRGNIRADQTDESWKPFAPSGYTVIELLKSGEIKGVTFVTDVGELRDPNARDELFFQRRRQLKEEGWPEQYLDSPRGPFE